MMCVFYQDELGVCCINGLDWSDGFKNNPKCCEDDGYGCKLKITTKDVKDMKQKLGQIKQLLKNAPIPPDEVPDAIMKILKRDEDG